MKTTLLLISLGCALFTSCTIDIPVAGGPSPMMMTQQQPYVQHGQYLGPGMGRGEYCEPTGFNRPSSNYYDRNQVVQVGDPRLRRYGNGPQSYVSNRRAPGDYDPNH
jgi:hypothetical protein